MVWNRFLSLLAVTAFLAATSCGGTHLAHIQIVPVDPNLATNSVVYVAPGGTVQYELIAWYSNQTSQTISSSQARWTSNNTAIASIDSSGLAASAGPIGVATITVSYRGRSATSTLSVCDPASFCPP